LAPSLPSVIVVGPTQTQKDYTGIAVPALRIVGRRIQGDSPTTSAGVGLVLGVPDTAPAWAAGNRAAAVMRDVAEIDVPRCPPTIEGGYSDVAAT